MLYFNFTFSTGMLPKGEIRILKRDLTVKEARDIISKNKVEICANPSHKDTFEVLRQKYKINLEIPKKPIKVLLKKGDKLLVSQIINLPRLTQAHQYNKEEAKKAKIRFMLIKIL